MDCGLRDEAIYIQFVAKFRCSDTEVLPGKSEKHRCGNGTWFYLPEIWTWHWRILSH
jgi:hypothetical protein